MKEIRSDDGTVIRLNVVVDLCEAARRLGVSYQTCWRWAVDGTLEAQRVARSWVVPLAAIERLLSERNAATRTSPE